ENSWDRGGGQYGYTVVLTPRPWQDSNNGAVPAILTTNVVDDVVLANNVVRNVGGFLATGLYDSQCVSPIVCTQSARLLVSDNMADYDAAISPSEGLSFGGMQDFSVKRNTFLGHNSGPCTPAPGIPCGQPATWGNRLACAGPLSFFGNN